MQSPSFLAHQRLMRSHNGRDNAASLFGIDGQFEDFEQLKGQLPQKCW
jgi:hypothetical protein